MDYTIGSRIRLLEMHDKQALPAGATGTIVDISIIWGTKIISVQWDAPNESRTLNVLDPEDRFEITRR
jgi:hypothetical protein